MIACYEGKTHYPPAHLIEPLAKALKVSTVELLGVKIIKQQRDPQHAALWWRLKKIESIPKRDQKALLHYLDALVQKTDIFDRIDIVCPQSFFNGIACANYR